MKRTITVILALIMIVSLCACGKAPELSATTETVESPAVEEPAVGMPNPMTECASLEEINAAVGGKLCHPPVMGVTDEKYFTIDCGDYTIAQYDFAVNGIPYGFRCAAVADRDISGIYVGEGTAFSDTPSGEEIEYCITDTVKAARWFNIDGQYVFSADEPEKIEEETFKMIAEELHELTFPGMIGGELEAYYAGLEGSYQDSWSQRASAEVVSNGDSITISVFWSSSAVEMTGWTMTAKRMEDGLLCYYDCQAYTHRFEEDGSESAETFEFPAEGFFSENEGKLYWNGAGDESCENCCFEKMEY